MPSIRTRFLKTTTVRDDADGFKARLADDSRPDLYRFFQHLPRLLAGPDARFSFFNGLGATSECGREESTSWMYS